MNEMDIYAILKVLPHRHPFLLVDSVISLEKGKSIKALKNVSINEPFFQGHFPRVPVMPGVLILEALAQTSGILAYKSSEQGYDILYFAGIDEVRFKRIVIPGDQITLQSELVKVRREIWKFNATATVNDQLACSAQLLLAAKRELNSD